MRKLFFFIPLLMILVFAGRSQQPVSPSPDYSEYPYWIEMMQDQEVNFYEVQAAFEAYWEGREVTKGSGWKPFKRWEWWQERHIYPDGTRHEPDKVYKAYTSWLAKHPQAKTSNGDWTNIGPIMLPSKGYEGLGRISAIAFHPTDPDIVYIGAPAGGFWKYDGTPAGWSSSTDDLPTLGVSAIVVDWSNPDRIFIGTGDRDAGDAAGLGVFRSLDGGDTWEVWNNGMGNRTVGRMVQHPSDPETILAATNGGLFKTTDGGANWVFKTSGVTKEVVFKPENPDVVYGGGNGKFYRSTDGGETWEQITNGIPTGSRSVIAVTPANPEVVYCLLSNGDSFKGLWKSTDSGESFTMMSNSPNIMSWGCNGGSGGQAWYDLDIAADPQNENVIFAGGVNCFKSSDGGVTWQISSHWWGDCNVPAVHADLHVLEYNPLNNRLYAGNDGGIYYTDNGGNTWPEITDGLPISQVYRIGQSATVKDKVINGYQDNGTSTWFGNNNWQTTNGGDGMECAVDHSDATITYSTIYYGDIYRHINNGNGYQVAGEGSHGMTESGGWITPFCLHEQDPTIMFVGMKNIWRAEGVTGNNFTWKKITSEGGDNIDVVEHSPADENLFYYARNQYLYRSDNVMDEQPDWVGLFSFLPGTGNVFDIEADPFDPEVVYITRGSKVYRSENRGYNWEDISGSLPDINMNSLARYVNSIDGIYAGSDAGVYYRDASMDDWIMFSNGLPVDASVNEIEIYHNPEDPSEDVIRAGTYGRGLWSSPVWHGVPEADFVADQTTVPVGCEVNFTDLSLGVPTSWLWTFEGGTPATSTDRNPQGVFFATPGTYSVTLTVTNDEGTDTKTVSGYMTILEGTAPEVGFMASDSSVCLGQTVLFTDMSSNCPTDWQWEFEPNDVSFINGTGPSSQNPEVVFNQSGYYTVTLTVSNDAGSSTLEKQDYIAVGGWMLPFWDDFESGTLEGKSWEVENPDFGITWDVTTVNGNGSNYAAWFNFYDYVVVPGGRDRLISPVLNFSNTGNDVWLSFDHAYAKRHSTVTDSLIVKVSDDCGSTWTRVFEGGEDGNGVFATHPLMQDPFYPETAEDWCGTGWGASCISVNLSQYIQNSANVRIMFETYNYFGNNLYIDNVMVAPLTASDEEVAGNRLRIYPNPAGEVVNVILPEGSAGATVELMDLNGKVITTGTKRASGHFRLDTGELASGLYLLRARSENRVWFDKVMIR